MKHIKLNHNKNGFSIGVKTKRYCKMCDTLHEADYFHTNRLGCKDCEVTPGPTIQKSSIFPCKLDRKLKDTIETLKPEDLTKALGSVWNYEGSEIRQGESFEFEGEKYTLSDLKNTKELENE
ncbi:MAG: hypothetical protein DRQ88_05960 [Epsilonproteobacteria bacterium]|nr:MAG: hypothetical protein DRQ88_05960 [Campylobacterota bacterium]